MFEPNQFKYLVAVCCVVLCKLCMKSISQVYNDNMMYHLPRGYLLLLLLAVIFEWFGHTSHSTH